MSYSYILPGEQSSSGAVKRWLFAYAVSQLVCLAATAGAAAIARAMLWPAGSNEAIALTVGVACVYGATFGYLRGCVIRTKLARFSMPAFCAAVAAVSLFVLPPAPDAFSALKTTFSIDSVLRDLGPVALTGFVYGIAIGAAEAFSLRRAALGLLTWVVLSGVAWSCGTATATLAVSLQPAAFAGSHVVNALLQATVAGIIMIAPLRALMPQLKYYGPRVYRDAVRTRG